MLGIESQISNLRFQIKTLCVLCVFAVKIKSIARFFPRTIIVSTYQPINISFNRMILIDPAQRLDRRFRQKNNFMVKPHGRLVPVSSTPYSASTSGLSTW